MQSYFKNLEEDINFPNSFRAKNGWRKFRVAFHMWQEIGFIRGE
jgi:hypothetical protein